MRQNIGTNKKVATMDKRDDIIRKVRQFKQLVIDLRIEPHVIARNTDYAGMIDEIERTGILIHNP
jgi:hypothetical protein